MKNISIITSSLLLAGSLYSQNIEVKQGWQLLGALDDINVTKFNNTCVDYVWKYDISNQTNPRWLIFSTNNKNSNIPSTIGTLSSLNKGDGFWINANNTCSIDTNGSTTENNNTTIDLNVSNEQYYRYLWHIDSSNSSTKNISQEVSNKLNNQYVIGSIDNNADINILEAWQTTKGENVIVAVIDDGADVNHEDLKENIHLAYNADDDSNDVSNKSTDATHASHGNTCAGFIAAPVNGKGIIGTAPKSKLIVIKQQSTSIADTIKAFEYAKNNGAKVISCSWGTENVSEAIETELKSLYDAGITVLFASGNDGKSLDATGIVDESEVQWVIGVGATGENNDVTNYSNYGANIDIIAPGGDASNSTGILGLDDTGVQGSTNNYNQLVTNNYQFSNGTSYATPVAAGVVALMYSVNPNITPDQVKNILTQSADKIGGTNATYTNGFDTKRAFGKINATKAVQAAQSL